jgi:hypothetical protein
MQQRLTVIILSLFLAGCIKSIGNQNDFKSEIKGVWVYDYEINNLHLNDSSDSFKTSQAVLFDFDQAGILKIKNYALQDTSHNWSIKDDSLLDVGGYVYSIFSLNSHSLALIDYNRNDTSWTVLKRPKETNIKWSKQDIQKLLLSRMWSIEEKNKRRWQTDFQFYENGFMSYRYTILDRMINDSANNIQIEKYGIEVYKGFHFLYLAPDQISGAGNNRLISQLLEINSNSYSLNEFGDGDNDTLRYTGRDFDQKRYNEIKSQLIGKWHSQNTREKTYGKYFPIELIENAEFIPFEGILTYQFDENDSVKVIVDGNNYINSKWLLGKDGDMLLFEHTVDDEYGKRVFIEYMNIEKFNKDSLHLRLYDHNLFLEETRPNRTILNIFQEFKKE